MLRSNKQMVHPIAITALVTASLFQLNCKRPDAYTESHAITRTRMDIQGASIEIQFYASETGLLPKPLLSPSDPAQDAKKLFSVLFPSESKSTIPQHWRQAQSLIDRWGNPLNFRAEPEKDAASYSIRMWSNGPNGSNDNGKGDDISPEPIRISLRDKKP